MGEGGGQILRTSLTLSCVLGEPFRMINIRAGREKPGLRPQHLTGLRAAAEICDATVGGGGVGSTEITFEPHKARAGSYCYEVGTAGSVSLVLHTILLPLALSGEENRVKIEGGTHVSASPPFEHLDSCWIPAMKGMNLQAVLDMQRAGYYPKGGGKIDVKIAPSAGIGPVEWSERGGLRRLTVRAAVSNLPDGIAERIISRSRRHAREAGISKEKVREEIFRPPAIAEGAYFFLLAEFEPVGAIPAPPAGFVSLGRKGKRAETLADEAWADLAAFLKTNAAIEPHLADQALLPLSLAGGASRYSTSSVTEHLLTNAQAIKNFGAAHIEITGNKGEPGLVHVQPAR